MANQLLKLNWTMKRVNIRPVRKGRIPLESNMGRITNIPVRTITAPEIMEGQKKGI
jgi:hypothetical protein